MIFTANLLPELRRDKASGGFISNVFGNDANECFVYGPFTSDNVDVVGDIVTKDGTVKAVGRWNNIRNIRFMHQPMPVGVATKLSYIDGLPWNEMEAKIIDDNTAKLARAGALKGYSIGARVLEWEPIEEEDDEDFFFFFGPMRILDYDLAETSVVDNPANRDALWSSVKGMKMVGDRPRHTLLTPNDIISVVPILGREKAMLLREEAAIVDYLVKHQTAGLNSRLWSEFAKPVTYSFPGVDKMEPEVKEEIILESVVIAEEVKAVDATIQEQATETVVTKELEVSSDVADVTNISEVPGVVYSTTGTSDGVISNPVAYDDTELRRTVDVLTVRIEELGNAVSQAMEKIASDIAGMHGAIKVQIDANEAAVTKINAVATSLEASLDELQKPISRTSKIDNPVASQDKPARNSGRLSVL